MEETITKHTKDQQAVDRMLAHQVLQVGRTFTDKADSTVNLEKIGESTQSLLCMIPDNESPLTILMLSNSHIGVRYGQFMLTMMYFQSSLTH